MACLRHARTAIPNRYRNRIFAWGRPRRWAHSALFAAAFFASRAAAFAQFPTNQDPANNQFPGYNPYPAYGQPQQSFSQNGGYPQSQTPQSMGAAYPAPIPAATATPSPQSSTQSDEQILTVAHLLEQQGRTAQAQRLYAELVTRHPRNTGAPAAGYAPAAGGFGSPSNVAMQPQWPSAGPWQTASQMPVSAPSGSRGSAPPLQSFYGSPAPYIAGNASAPAFGQPTNAAVPLYSAQPNGQAQQPYVGSPNAPGQLPQAEPTVQQMTPYSPLHPTDSLDPASEVSASTAERAARNPPNDLESASSQSTSGWHAAMTPLPAALASAGQNSSAITEPSAATSQATVMDSPEAPHHSSTPDRVANYPDSLEAHPLKVTTEDISPPVGNDQSAPPASRADQDGRTPPEHSISPAPGMRLSTDQPPLFAPADSQNLERRAPAPTEQEGWPALKSPSPSDVAPLKNFERERKIAAELARETEEIRIIPKPRVNRSHTGANGSIDGSDQSGRSPGDDGSSTRWKTHVSSSNDQTATGSLGAESTRPDVASFALDREPLRSRAGTVQMPAEQTTPEGAGPNRGEDRQTAATPPELRRTRAANSAAPLSLAAYLNDPDFREIHSPPVLEGLTLLAQPEANHRSLGAMRIGLAGPNGRTAMPVLRKLVKVEPDKTVRLRIAEAMLKVQPGDLDAANCLAELLADRADWQVRQTAACALAAAAGGHNQIAVVRLTEALDDGNPRVRTMAALSLAQFGAEAADSLGRLETAAASDVPRVQAAATAALASIRRESNPRDRNTAPPMQPDVSLQQPVKTELGFAQLDEHPGLLRPAPAVVKLLDVPSDQPTEPPADAAAPKSEKQPTACANANASGATSVVRPLRLEPSQHHHVPGKPSQPPLPARPVMQLDSSDRGDGKASPNP